MITNGYMTSTEDADKLREIKESDIYSIYMKSIATSPAYKALINEHVENIDITPDIERLKAEKKLPDSVNSKALSDLFKGSISKMMIPLVADSIILKELETVKVDEVVEGLRTDTDAIYLLGMADKEYYEEAQKLVEQGKITEDDIAFKGLISFMKRKGNLPQAGIRVESYKRPVKKKVKKTPAKAATGEKKQKVDLSSNDISL